MAGCSMAAQPVGDGAQPGPFSGSARAGLYWLIPKYKLPDRRAHCRWQHGKLQSAV